MTDCRHLDLFSGIGGFALAASWAGYDTVQFVEIDPFCRRVLGKHWPEVPVHDDITTFDGRPFRGTVDLLTGGFPCQPYSVAGQRRGAADDRALWPQMFRVIDEARPRWVLAENVPGFISLGLDDCLLDLEGIGYETGALVVPAAGVGAPHRRDRLWIVAHAECGGRWESLRVDTAQGALPPSIGAQGALGTGPGGSIVPDTESLGLQAALSQPVREGAEVARSAHNREDAADTPAPRSPQRRSEARGPVRDEAWWTEPQRRDWWKSEPDVGRVATRVPARVDRLKSLGNAIVPAVAYEIIRHLTACEERA